MERSETYLYTSYLIDKVRYLADKELILPAVLMYFEDEQKRGSISYKEVYDYLSGAYKSHGLNFSEVKSFKHWRRGYRLKNILDS